MSSFQFVFSRPLYLSLALGLQPSVGWDETKIGRLAFVIGDRLRGCTRGIYQLTLCRICCRIIQRLQRLWLTYTATFLTQVSE